VLFVTPLLARHLPDNVPSDHINDELGNDDLS
jgi:hypothetical protein